MRGVLQGKREPPRDSSHPTSARHVPTESQVLRVPSLVVRVTPVNTAKTGPADHVAEGTIVSTVVPWHAQQGTTTKNQAEAQSKVANRVPKENTLQIQVLSRKTTV